MKIMPIRFIHIAFQFVIISFLAACSSKIYTSNYYFQHAKVLDKIEETYKQLYPKGPFTVGFTDKQYQTLSLQIITDTLSYIYEFGVNEPRLTDTLVKYNLDAPKVIELVKQMQAIRCTWIKNFEYYVDEKEFSLIFLSVKPVALNVPFLYKKYYVLTYFQQPQYFDANGKLLDKRKLRRLRKINGEIFNRINDKVCYTISGNFR